MCAPVSLFALRTRATPACLVAPSGGPDQRIVRPATEDSPTSDHRTSCSPMMSTRALSNSAARILAAPSPHRVRIFHVPTLRGFVSLSFEVGSTVVRLTQLASGAPFCALSEKIYKQVR